MKRKIFSRLCLLSVASAVLSCVLIFGVMFVGFNTQMQTNVRQNAAVLAEVLNTTGKDDVAALQANRAGGMRLTLVASDGNVLYDSASNTTENHASRPEIIDALANGEGESTRLSDTMQKQTYYYAVQLDGGDVLRVSATTDSVFKSAAACIPYIILAVIFVSVLAMLTARTLTRRLVAPINNLDLEHPSDNDTYEELSPLLGRVEKQSAELSAQMQTMQRMRDELADIMENMNEGLIVLSAAGTVLSINRSALQIMNKTKQEALGKYLLVLNRGEVFQALAIAAQKGENAEADLTQNEHIYHVSLSRANHGGNILMLVDVTAKRAAEQMRREFSANVSHELKTPLQTISGYAELMKSGMVAQADQARFIGHIYDESMRMINLVQDIINLSRLDEGVTNMPQEDVDLFTLAQQTVEALQEKAKGRQVTLSLEGSKAMVYGVRRLLQETIFNLCDNAIVYNKANGHVTVSAFPGAQGVVLKVQDTGIGIPPAEQQRVFERFYRVDKSHSRATGGTGLGLSIVKHAALLHGAAIALDSRPNEGTLITLTFPPTGI